ncbi:cell division protein FtsB [Methylibium sp.]|uniref:cell division protein FtsB n=1 Tax=Methylibium sp. TaxID=2067992 RepID=UPI00286A8577|nr:cell division protein FtsB [Methylibium sp.]
MRLVTFALIALLALVQAELWFGKGGLGRAMGLQSRLVEQQHKNAVALARNERLAAEVRDLEVGLEMVEEKARFELGMVKPDEIYVRVAPRR